MKLFKNDAKASLKIAHKHDANVQKNTLIYFQIGLIACLLFVNGLFEMNFVFSATNNIISGGETIYEPLPEIINEYEIEKIYKPKIQSKEKLVDTNQNPEVNPDDTDLEETENTVIKKPLINNNPPVRSEDLPDIEPPVEDDFNILAVQKVPVYPGCESAKNNQERRQCMEEKISKYIQKKFNTDVVSSLGITGIQRVDVMFKIDKFGKIVDVKARGPQKHLEHEAIRIIRLLPDLQPGMNNNIPVNVIYNLPIVVDIQ